MGVDADDVREPRWREGDDLELAAAFREVHGRSLHGFALLVHLNAEVAAERTAHALAEGERRAARLRHPERAAAWLRRRVAAGERRRFWRRTSVDPEAVQRLLDLGASAGAVRALGRLSLLERGCLVADVVERLDVRDVGVVTGRRGVQLERLRRRAFERFSGALGGTR